MKRRPAQRAAGLEDRSHLFLSSSRPDSGRAAGERPAVIYLCAAAPAFVRAMAAAGTARALEASGMDVTLIETGAGLPNAGYYFGLPARDYLSPSVCPGSVVEGRATPALRYFCFRELPDPFTPPPGPSMPGRPRVTVVAYGPPDSFERMPFEPGEAAALVLFDLEGGSPFGESERDSFETHRPEMPVFLVSKAHCGEGAERPPARVLPDTVIGRLADRAVSSDPFFYGLSSEILQRIVSAVSG